jgi:hypothetical protein
MYRELIISKLNNKGALSSLLNNKKNIDVLNYLNNNIIKEVIDLPIIQKLWYFVNDIKEFQICNCGEKLKFIDFKSGYRKTCGDEKCYIELRKISFENNKENHKVRIVPHHMTDEKIKNKVKNTMKEKYGVEYVQQNKDISKKSSETFNNNLNKQEIIDKRANTFKNLSLKEKEKIKTKKENTIIKKYGSLENFYNYRKEKIKEASILKNNTEHHWESEEFITSRVQKYKDKTTEKILKSLPDYLEYIDRKPNVNNTDNIYELKCLNCNKIFFINRGYYVLRLKENKNICLICNPKLSGVSKMELELFNFVKDNYKGDILHNTKSIIDNKELDIYIPDLKLAIEFNGLYWHSNAEKNKMYHYDKFIDCKNKNIYLIHIYEDDWVIKKEIIKNIIIANLTNYNYDVEITDVYDINEIKEFINENYIYDYKLCDVNIVAFNDDGIKSIMMFDKKNDYHEMYFPCFKEYSERVIIAMFNFFTNKYKSNVKINIDSSYIIKDIYKKLNFEELKHSLPEFYYICNEKRINTDNENYYGIYDSGKIEYLFKYINYV